MGGLGNLEQGSERLIHRRRTKVAELLRPLLRTVQDANNVNDIPGDLVDHDIGQRRNYEFARPVFPAFPAAIRERQQRGGAM